MFNFREFKKDENGSTVILAILIIFLLCGMGGFAVDASYLYRTKGEMTKAANAAALSGAQQLYTDTERDTYINNASETIDYIIGENNEADCTKDVKIMEEDDPNTPRVTVTLDKTVSTFFMKTFFNVSSVPISVTSNAIKDVEVIEMGGLRPLGINKDSLPLKVGEKYLIKDDDKIGDKGWFGFIDLSGEGQDGDANVLKDFMLNGSPYLKAIGDYVGIGHGNKTSIINYLESNEITKLTVPIIVYELVEDPDKNKEMEITGFAMVEITYTKKEIYGEFIKTVNLDSDTGLTDEYRVFKTRLVK